MEFGLKTESLTVDMAAVQRRKRHMVRELRDIHAEHIAASGAELIRGLARFIAPRTVEIEPHDGSRRTIRGARVFLDLGSRAAIPQVPGLAEATPMTHVEALELDRLPKHLIVLGGGYVGLELSQAFRRFGSNVRVIEHGLQLASREDPDVGAALKDLFVDEGIEVLLDSTVRRVEGRSCDRVRVSVSDERGDRLIDGTDLLVAPGREPNTNGIRLDKTGVQLDERGYIETMYPVFGIRGACYLLGVSEWIFCLLIFIGFWNKTAGVLGALGGIASFVGTRTIIPFMPDGWAASAGGFPAMTERVAFLMKDLVLLAVSFYLLKQDLLRLSIERSTDTRDESYSGELPISPNSSKRTA